MILTIGLKTMLQLGIQRAKKMFFIDTLIRCQQTKKEQTLASSRGETQDQGSSDGQAQVQASSRGGHSHVQDSSFDQR